MRRALTAVVVAVALAACTTKEKEVERTDELPPGPTQIRDAGVTGPSDARAPGDDGFRAAAEQAAARHQGTIAAWGTANLDEDPAPERFATLAPADALHEDGAYLLEDGERRWLVRFHADGRTQAFGVEPEQVVGADAPWASRAEAAIEHTQGERGGYESVTFALRGGIPVVLRHETLDRDAEDGKPTVVELARDGVCRTPCPPLAEWIKTHDSAIRAVEELP